MIAEQCSIRGQLKLLTPREREVFEYVVVGFPNKRIAWKLGVREGTIKAHRQQIMQKMQAESLAQLVAMKYITLITQLCDALENKQWNVVTADDLLLITQAREAVNASAAGSDGSRLQLLTAAG